MGLYLSVPKRRTASQQLQAKPCLECLKWVELWLPESPLWPRKLWRVQAILSLPPDWSKRNQPSKATMPQRYKTWQSHRLILTPPTLQRTTPMTKPPEGSTIKDQRQKNIPCRSAKSPCASFLVLSPSLCPASVCVHVYVCVVMSVQRHMCKCRTEREMLFV